MNSHEDSYLNTFNCGNLETLKQDGIREALLDFHKKYYSSNIMKLVVSSKYEIEKLESWVRSLFSAVPNKQLVVPNLGEPVPFDEKNLGQLFKYVPIKDKDVLTFFWSLPYSEMEYKSQPLKYHAHLFGHEGPNSLLSWLISEGLALELMSSFDHELRAFSTFNIDITLTKKGL
mmetsp:Transcript_21921/g.21111  ORF Transcript_21921/g.21111 Transcript_21921/m.21111 type:complete len:174 (+) Transcript_21921:489-1010(+)